MSSFLRCREDGVTVPAPVKLSKPEQVISYENGNHRLHCEALERIFRGNTRDVPLLVVSINGPTGKGKSMMINLLADYLQHLENEIQSPWEYSNDIVSGMRFEPRRRQGERTLGMHMWHRPFMITTDAGKVAVLLADCQGSNGLRNTNENIEHEIQLLSLALADVQLINVDDCIDATTLDSIKNLVESMSNNCSNSEFPEDLIFLCRNVPQDGEKYGEHQEDFTKAVDGCDMAHQEALRCIMDKFNSETTFTFPHPGKKAAGAKLGDGEPLHINDLPPDFNASLMLLVKYIIGRQVSGGTGDSLIRRFQALKDPVESGKINEGLTTASNVKRDVKAMQAIEEAKKRVDMCVKQLNGEIQANLEETDLSVEVDTKMNEIIEDYDEHAITSGEYCATILKEYIDGERSKLLEKLNTVKREKRLKDEKEATDRQNTLLKYTAATAGFIATGAVGVAYVGAQAAAAVATSAVEVGLEAAAIKSALPLP